MRLDSNRFGCFGKLPVSREFLVDGAGELARSGFDDWMAEGLGLAKMNAGNERFRSLALGFSPIRFVWSMPEGTRAAAGVLVPSEDGAGRIHPFSVFAWIDRAESAPDDPTHPLFVRAVHDYLDRLLAECRAATDPAAVLQVVRTATLDFERSAHDEYAAFIRTRSLDALFRELDASLQVPGLVGSLREQLVQALHESVSYLRGRPPIDIRLGIRCPLAPSFGATHQVCVWIDLIRRMFGSAVPGPCSFWPHPGLADSPGGTRPPVLTPGSFHFFFSRPSSAQWISLFDPDASLETISAIEQPYAGDPGDRMAPALRTIMRTPTATLSDLLERARG
ncbi:MAG: type VI secretion system-associated protein TagF [Candidatus Eisenbacteria bacterium]|nr:type VI secretion system-associated protein TagF [Candidatus Eisenbacteria bacterium]